MSRPLCDRCGKEMYQTNIGNWLHYWTKDFFGPCPGGRPTETVSND